MRFKPENLRSGQSVRLEGWGQREKFTMCGDSGWLVREREKKEEIKAQFMAKFQKRAHS